MSRQLFIFVSLDFIFWFLECNNKCKQFIVKTSFLSPVSSPPPPQGW